MKRSKTISIILIAAIIIVLFIKIFNNRNTEIEDKVIKESIEDIYIKNGQTSKENDFTKEDDFIKLQKLDDKYNKISDYGKGFTMSYYQGMSVDSSLSNVKTTMSSDDIIIEVYYDDLTDRNANYADYTSYSNKFLENNPKDHNKEFESNKKVNRRNTHILIWSRDKLKHIENDKNHYMSAEIQSNNNKNEIYTIFMKSSKPFKTEDKNNYMDIIESFRIIEKQATAKVNTTFKPSNKNLNDETKEFHKKYFSETSKMRWGIFENDVPEQLETLDQLEERMNYDFEFVVRYDFFSSPEILPLSGLENAYEHGKAVELTFQTTYDYKTSPSNLYEILDGKYDDYFKQYASRLKEFNHPVLFRLNNEMNGDWCEYSSYHFSKDTEMFKESWKYIHDLFEENGVDNVLWVWNPHDISFPDFAWNNYLNYYPGDEYVDIVGLTGYNNGTYYPGEVWREFEEIYDPIYKEYSEIFEHPLMITEFSANSVGGDKIEWIKDMFDKIKKYDRLKVAIWWNNIDWDQDENPARLYRLDESEEMLDTFKEGFKEYK